MSDKTISVAWEYQHLSFLTSDLPFENCGDSIRTNFEDSLNMEGIEGWEVVSVVFIPTLLWWRGITRVTLKRPLNWSPTDETHKLKTAHSLKYFDRMTKKFENGSAAEKTIAAEFFNRLAVIEADKMNTAHAEAANINSREKR